MENFEKLQHQLSCARTLKNSLDNHFRLIGEPRVDKHGLGFNKDSRFSAAKVTVSVDSWTGEFGDSGCGRSLRVLDEKLFQESFLEVLNENFNKLIYSTAEKMEKKALRNVEKARVELSTALEGLNKISEQQAGEE